MDTSREKFLFEFHKTVGEFFEGSKYPTKLVDRTKQMIDYMIPNYNKTIAPFLIMKVSKIIKPNLNEKEVQMAISFGWIYQLFEAFILTQDDYFDDGDQRNGKTSWSKLHNHSKSVIVHDAALMRQLTFFTIQKMYSNSVPIYLQLVELFLDHDNEFTRGCTLDAYLHMKNLREGNVDLKSFNEKNYNLMASLKLRGFVSTPIALAMIVTGFQVEKNGELYKNIKSIHDDLAIIATAFDDYYDTFPPSSKLRSKDSDIRRGQFTWLFVVAKENCKDNEDIQKLIKHYGRDEDESVIFVKELYRNIGIRNLFEKYCKDEHDKIMKKVDTLFVRDKKVHEILTWYFPFIIKFMKDGALGLFD